MPVTNGAGIITPASSDNTQLWVHLATMADSISPRLKPVFADPAARDAAFPSPAFGDEAAVVSTGEWYWYNGTAWVSRHPRWAYKTVGESVTANTTLQDDDHLFVSMEATSRYHVEGMMWAALGGNVPGLKLALQGPTSSTLTWRLDGNDATSGNPDWGAYDAISGTAGSTKSRPTSSGGALGYKVDCICVTAASAGTFRVRWAEVSASATTTLSPNSFLKVTKYA